eukprot:TRINITY_DN2117_c0_g1_i1.p1 TRINITY_DN2117_c0_g1~~TRINITY_DN2117_c0_g1_i1.p1  ORF type:complete len:269 (-),score=86.75 TRINITY_DN2117_c0_g1_i1:136-894(-)
MGVPVLEIHSRKSQPHRASVAAKFANGTGLVLFTSDVSARGVDYDDVTHVVQVGLPSDKAQYVHRLGRTGRAGKEGQGILLLSDFESIFLRSVQDLPLVRIDAPASPAQLSEEAERVAGYLSRLPGSSTTAAYQAWLGFYNSHLKRLNWSKEQLVANANNWYANVCGRAEPPALQAKTVGKMGLRGPRGSTSSRGVVVVVGWPPRRRWRRPWWVWRRRGWVWRWRRWRRRRWVWWWRLWPSLGGAPPTERLR